MSIRAAERIRAEWEDPEFRKKANIKESTTMSEWNEYMAKLNRAQARRYCEHVNDRYYG